MAMARLGWSPAAEAPAIISDANAPHATAANSAQPPTEPRFVEPSPAMKSRTIRIELPDDL